MKRTRNLIKFYYIGSGKYFGSQRQLDYETIEDYLIASLCAKNYIDDPISGGFEVASRTDKFVTARGACFSFLSEKAPILMELNSVLPRDIGLWAFAKINEDFSSRFNAENRHYKYIVPFPEDMEKIYNLELMLKACKVLEGRHDFSNFSKREKCKTNTTRDILLADFKVEKGFIIFDFKSRAFLRQQIRRMVAKLLEVGEGLLSFDNYLKLLNSEVFVSYQPADPTGLILWDILYEDKIHFTIDIKSYERMIHYFENQFSKYSLKQKLFDILQHGDIGQ
jgi:tRNA pseudouridine38-40 synthase